MATGTVPTSFTGLKNKDHGLGFSKSMDFVKICDLQRVKFSRTKVSVNVITNSSSGSEIAELQPASEGSPLLGIISCLVNSVKGVYSVVSRNDCLFKLLIELD